MSAVSAQPKRKRIESSGEGRWFARTELKTEGGCRPERENKKKWRGEEIAMRHLVVLAI